MALGVETHTLACMKEILRNQVHAWFKNYKSTNLLSVFINVLVQYKP